MKTNQETNPIKSLVGIFFAALRLLLPERCVLCGRRLEAREHCVCTVCYALLPFTHLRARRGNPMERIFWWRVPVRRASALLRYQPGAASCKIFFKLKYGNRPQAGIYFGRIMATDLLDTGFFDDIDGIVPVPLSQKRERKRGYNQSLMLARGVAEITGLPVWPDAAERIVDNPQQARLRPAQRQENVKGIFRLRNKAQLEQRHVLIVDDVLTTGATILSLAREICTAQGSSVSILTLGLAGQHGTGPAHALSLSGAST